MKIGILGTRGVPNNHGGFEQFAAFLSEYLAQEGHDVYVYNSHDHPYQEKEWKGVNIIHQFDLEYKIGTAGQFFYDLNCILDSRKRNFDILLQLGYTSSSIWHFLLPKKKSLIITNMDGLEWKRSKYSKKVQKFLLFAEKLAAKSSHHLVSDSIGIQEYIQNKYQLPSEYIAYGATLFNNPTPSILSEYGLDAENYNMLIARLEPENSIEIILDGVAKSNSNVPFIVVGKHETPYGQYLKDKFKGDQRIQFLGGIYNLEHLNNLRYYSKLYFHGHTVGGTNPSLLEAMASNASICAHNNGFNRYILENDAYYFTNAEEVATLMDHQENNQDFISANRHKIEHIYDWKIINKAYLDFFKKCMMK